MIKNIYKKFLPLILLSALSFAIFSAISQTKAFESLEQWTFDLRQIAFAPETKASQDIVMIWLDENTMKHLPFRSPVPRTFLADLQNKLSEAEPRLIAYDIFFKDPSFANADEVFSKSLARGNTYAVMPMRISGCPDDMGTKDGCADLPLPLFLKSLKGIGLADLPFNPFDSVVRRTKFSFNTDLGDTPSFAALLFKDLNQKNAGDVIKNKKIWPHVGPFYLTPFVSNSKETFIRFAGPPSKIGGKENVFKVFSAELAAKGLLPKTWIENKIVLVGAAYEDLQDAYMTPYYARFTNYARMNGVEIHANILSSLLTEQFYFTLTRPQFYFLIVIAILFSMTFAALCPPSKSAITLSASIVTYLFLVVVSFKRWGIIVPALSPVSAGVVSYVVGTSWRALTEGRQRRWIKGVFSQYVPNTVVERIVQDPDSLKLGGEQRNVTSFFSDIASFTTISEKMDPPTLVKFLNEYLTLMNDILFRYGGTIDKYEGDAIVAFFNAPLNVDKHESAAVFSALEVQIASGKISDEWKERLGREIITRIGINTGPAVVGNVGSQSRFDYTAIGDTINLTSRLEGANKFYGTKVMASETTVKGLDSSFITRPLDRIRVKGKDEPVTIYEIMGRSVNGQPEGLVKLSSMFKSAFERLNTRSLDEGLKLLDEIIRKYPDDVPSKELAKKFEKAKKELNWDLITELSSK